MKDKHDVPEALIGILVTLSLGFKKNGSADSRALTNVKPAKMFKTDAIVPPLTPPDLIFFDICYKLVIKFKIIWTS